MRKNPGRKEARKSQVKKHGDRNRKRVHKMQSNMGMHK